MDYIKNTALNAQSTGGAVGKPTFSSATTIISTKSADMSGGHSSMTEYSHENLSAKYKNGAQDIPAKGRNQYERNETDVPGGN